MSAKDIYLPAVAAAHNAEPFIYWAGQKAGH